MFVPKTYIQTTFGGEAAARVLYAKLSAFANDGWKATPQRIKDELSAFLDPQDAVLAHAQVEAFMGRNAIAHLGTIGSGSKLVASRKFLKKMPDVKSEDISAFETEALGVAYACERHGTDYVVVRAIMDFADGESRHRKIRKSLRHIAKVACGRFVADFLGQL